ELSLVDVGANPNANIELVKADGAATEALAAEDVPAPEVVPVAESDNRFAKKLIKAIEETTPPAAPVAETPAPVETAPETPPVAKDEMALAAPAACAKCMKVHGDGVEECEKEELAAKPETEKTAEPEVKKMYEEWDIRAALEILEGLKNLLYNETIEADQEPPAQRVALEAAIENVKAFIVSEAVELEAAPADGGAVEAAAKPSLLKTLAAAMDARDARFLAAFEEKITKTQTPAPAAPEGLFKVTDGDQLAEGIGKGLTSALAPIAKAQAEFNGRFDSVEAELKGVRKSIVELGKTAAVPTPLRTVPREEIAPRRASDNGVAALERALASTSHPETMVLLRQQIAIAKASVNG
ncbi:MAG: hypothetical protein PHS14_20535, partial [Elusimicrobia bacterium]|nr:hypothetical protein [Elusimicrobiota bacterium]